MLLEDTEASQRPVRISEPHFPAFEAFHGTSYADRYQMLCEKLIRERLYDAACLLMSSESGGRRGEFMEPAAELAFTRFAASLAAHATGYAKYRQS